MFTPGHMAFCILFPLLDPSVFTDSSPLGLTSLVFFRTIAIMETCQSLPDDLSLALPILLGLPLGSY